MWRKPRTWIACAVLVVALGLAVPSVLDVFEKPEPHVGTVPVQASEPEPQPETAIAEAPAAAREEEHDETVAEVPAAAPAVAGAGAVTSKDGDLSVTMKLRWAEYESGDRVLAKVTFTNHAMLPVYLPAPGEPDGGMAIVVEDENGSEVRHVVETTRGEQLPRRMVRLDPGRTLEVPVVLVAEDETPLPPGTYNAYVEMKPDPLLRRLGLAVWTAPKGAIRSAGVPLIVNAKTP